uniref:Uncharacterized protein n=1 Tax=Clytia hemisphaerica TaxID=252671 RepID=A0A7M5TUC6_9CNID
MAATTELMLAIKTLNLQKVAELLAKMKKNGKSNGTGDSNNNMQISLINAAMDSGSVDMLQMVLNKAKESEKSKEASSQQKPEESNSQEESTKKEGQIQSSDKAKAQNPKFLENAFKAWKSKIKKPETDKTTETGASAKPKYRRPSCPSGIDEKYFLEQNRRHCVSQAEERAEDLEEYDRNREKAYQEEVAKAEEMLKSLKARSRRKHSVGKML